ncbi:MAG: hypothetical protein Q7V62_02265 [Actinomycetota bacterium]|nr:hypothetical protein [Actinomycetota bacterium]
MKLHVPLPLARAVPIALPPSRIVTVEFASALPAIAGVVSLVTVSTAGVVIDGAAGTAVSTVITRAVDAGLVSPAASVEVAVSVCAPEPSGVPGAKLQAPPALAVVVPIGLAPSRIVTVEFGSALPAISGVESLVEMSPAGVVIDGAVGAAVSTVKLRVADPALPATSTDWTVMEWGPSIRSGAVKGELQAPAVPPSMAHVVVPG